MVEAEKQYKKQQSEMEEYEKASARASRKVEGEERDDKGSSR